MVRNHYFRPHLLNLKSKNFHSLNFSKVCSCVGSIFNMANSIIQGMPLISFQTIFYLFANRFYLVLVTRHYLTMYFKYVQFVCYIFYFITDLNLEIPRRFHKFFARNDLQTLNNLDTVPHLYDYVVTSRLFGRGRRSTA